MPNYKAQDLAQTRATRIAMRRRLIDVVEAKRKELGHTQNTFCNMHGINAATYNEIIRGNGERVSIDSLVLWLLRVGVNVEFVISEDGQ